MRRLVVAGLAGAYGMRSCGTGAGYMAHRRAGQKPCDACRIAWAARQREYRARKETESK